MIQQDLRCKLVFACSVVAIGSGIAVAPPSASARGYLPTQGSVPKDSYKISPGDLISITVLKYPEYFINAKVLPDGTFAYPFLGVINAKGLTREQLQKTITDKLISSKQLVRPIVTVNIVGTEVKEVIVSGTVRGGKVALKDGDRILDVLGAVQALSGTDRYEFFTAELFRGSTKTPLDLAKIYANDQNFNLVLEGGDQIIINAKPKNSIAITVIGLMANGHGGTVELPRDKSIISVLNELGGVSDLASLKNATILRGDKTISVDLRGYKKGRLDKDFILEPGDIINIPKNEEHFKINGQVAITGELPYPEDRVLTLFDALTMAKIPPTGAELKNVRLTRAEKGVVTTRTFNVDNMLKGDRTKDIELIPGDEIYVPATDLNKRRLGPMEILTGISGVAGLLFALRNIR